MCVVLLFDEIIAISDPVERAAVAHDLLWNDHPQRVRLRTVHGLAIQEAIGRGLAVEEIADRLRVRVPDLTWMSEQATFGPRERTAPGPG
ncbi:MULTISPECIES: hypothetical protein [Protofrankia]|uniref:Uncharacterized protein n=1 Tax=Candidatus Protofrankia datiscae TaxID=2716812 RepID=F8B5B6_9ACTN|nr:MULTISPECIES: hypothetical protein [Protofrankia]AEH07968.1 hypothetical protein FsymDg_0411 [Candidatus Protofrankia datiscae]